MSDNSTLYEVLLSLGVNIASSAIYDFLKEKFSINANLSKNELKQDLTSILSIQNSDIIADKIIDFLAKNGDIRIEGSTIYANNSISMFSSNNTNFSFGNNSSSQTKNTRIDAGKGAYIVGQGGAGIKQNEDGSISFFA